MAPISQSPAGHHPSFTSKLPHEARDLEHFFLLSPEKLQEIVKEFVDEFEDGLSRYGCDMAMVSSPPVHPFGDALPRADDDGSSRGSRLESRFDRWNREEENRQETVGLLRKDN